MKQGKQKSIKLSANIHGFSSSDDEYLRFNLGQQSNLNLQAPETKSNQGLANAEKASIQQKLNKKKMRKGQTCVNLRAIEVQSLHYNYSTIKITLSLRSQPTNLILKK